MVPILGYGDVDILVRTRNDTRIMRLYNAAYCIAITLLATLYPFMFSTRKVMLGTTTLANLDRTFYGDMMVPLCASYSDCMSNS